MRVYRNPQISEWEKLVRRPVLPRDELGLTLQQIFSDIQDYGDEALRRYTSKYDGIAIKDTVLSTSDISILADKVSPDLKNAIDQAYNNIQLFHSKQYRKQILKVVTQPGVTCWQENRAIEKVGLYIPGGSAPLFSTVLMLGVPAQLAGCKEIVLCAPPQSTNIVDPAICYAAQLTGVTTIAKVGGIQAIAAMTFGTASIPAVFKIFGPGNQFVTAAKEFAGRYGVARDIPAGPSEILVLADSSANPLFVAADLLSQAEHGNDSQVVLVSTNIKIIDEVKKEISRQLKFLPRQEIAKEALKNSFAVLFNDINTAMNFVNIYAPEHLILSVAKPAKMIRLVQNAGSVFLGNYTAESAGDYASGTNHTLPTSGWARVYSGLTVSDFVKKISFQSMTIDGLRQLAPTIVAMANSEGLEAHAKAVILRLSTKDRL